jgi:hypothetical protein
MGGSRQPLHDLRSLASWTHALAYLTRQTPVRLSVAQLTMFALAALGDRMGSPMNLTQLKDTLEGAPGGTITSTYTIFFEEHQGSRRLGWLWQEPCPVDQRVKWLRLTPKGEAVMATVMKYLGAVG